MRGRRIHGGRWSAKCLPQKPPKKTKKNHSRSPDKIRDHIFIFLVFIGIITIIAWRLRVCVENFVYEKKCIKSTRKESACQQTKLESIIILTSFRDTNIILKNCPIGPVLFPPFGHQNIVLRDSSKFMHLVINPLSFQGYGSCRLEDLRRRRDSRRKQRFGMSLSLTQKRSEMQMSFPLFLGKTLFVPNIFLYR